MIQNNKTIRHIQVVRTITVSYTHLDVYKRQLLNGLPTGIHFGPAGSQNGGHFTGSIRAFLGACVLKMCIRDSLWAVGWPFHTSCPPSMAPTMLSEAIFAIWTAKDAFLPYRQLENMWSASASAADYT